MRPAARAAHEAAAGIPWLRLPVRVVGRRHIRDSRSPVNTLANNLAPAASPAPGDVPRDAAAINLTLRLPSASAVAAALSTRLGDSGGLLCRAYGRGSTEGDYQGTAVPGGEVNRRKPLRASQLPAGEELFTSGGLEFDGRELTMHISRCKRVADLADIVTGNGGRLNGIHLTALWSALAWMHVHSAHRAEPGSVQHGVLADLILLTRERAQHLSSRSVAGVLHALGTLSPRGTNHHSLADLLVRRATERAADFCPRDAAQLLHGLSNLDLQSRAVSRLLAAMQGALAAKAAQCDAHTIAVAVSSVSRMGAPAAPEMLSALQARAAAIAGSFTAQGVANLMVGLAHLGGEARLSAALSRAFQRVAQEGAGDFSAPPPRTKWTRRVPHPVLIGHAASLSQVTSARRMWRSCSGRSPRWESPPTSASSARCSAARRRRRTRRARRTSARRCGRSR